jgi:hypothetical protein
MTTEKHSFGPFGVFKAEVKNGTLTVRSHKGPVTLPAALVGGSGVEQERWVDRATVVIASRVGGEMGRATAQRMGARSAAGHRAEYINQMAAQATPQVVGAQR